MWTQGPSRPSLASAARSSAARLGAAHAQPVHHLLHVPHRVETVEVGEQRLGLAVLGRLAQDLVRVRLRVRLRARARVRAKARARVRVRALAQDLA